MEQISNLTTPFSHNLEDPLTPPSLLDASSTISSKERNSDQIVDFVREKLESKARKEAPQGQENCQPTAAAHPQSKRIVLSQAIENFKSENQKKRECSYAALVHFLEEGGYDSRIFQAATVNILRGGELCQTGIGFYKALFAKGIGIEEGAKIAAFLIESEDASQICDGCDLFIELLKQDTKPIKISLMGPPESEEQIAILGWLKLAVELAKRDQATSELEKAVNVYLSHESTEVCKRAYEFFELLHKKDSDDADDVWI